MSSLFVSWCIYEVYHFLIFCAIGYKPFQYVPTKFALANRPTYKKGDMIIRDERERSWKVKLCSFGDSVCIKGGWHEFCDANCLKEGDCIMFEVVSNGKKTIWKYNGKFPHSSKILMFNHLILSLGNRLW